MPTICQKNSNNKNNSEIDVFKYGIFITHYLEVISN